jgi:hypothetical protein
MAFQVRKAPFVVAILKRIDAVLFTLTAGVTHTFRGIPFAHHLVKQLIKVGVPIELVTTHDQAADLVLAEADLGKGRAHGLLRTAYKRSGRKRCCQSGGRLQKGSSTVHMICTSA